MSRASRSGVRLRPCGRRTAASPALGRLDLALRVGADLLHPVDDVVPTSHAAVGSSGRLSESAVRGGRRPRSA